MAERATAHSVKQTTMAEQTHCQNRRSHALGYSATTKPALTKTKQSDSS